MVQERLVLEGKLVQLQYQLKATAAPSFPQHKVLGNTYHHAQVQLPPCWMLGRLIHDASFGLQLPDSSTHLKQHQQVDEPAVHSGTALLV